MNPEHSADQPYRLGSSTAVAVASAAFLLAGYLLFGRAAPPSASDAVTPLAEPHGAAGHNARMAARQASVGGQVAGLTRQMAALRAQLERETEQRRALEQRIEALGAQVAGLAPVQPAAATAPPAMKAAQQVDVASDNSAVTSEVASTTLERALVSAGIDPATAAEIKRRRDDLTMAEMYLRDQAAREQWIDTPQFKEELENLQRQQTTLREDIGDDSYDHYLTATGEPNRVRVDDVMAQSPAAEAGIQVGDLVLRYDDTRIFAPIDLVNETRNGSAGEMVQVEILRHGERLQIDVPRGPLGLRIAAIQGSP